MSDVTRTFLVWALHDEPRDRQRVTELL